MTIIACITVNFSKQWSSNKCLGKRVKLAGVTVQFLKALDQWKWTGIQWMEHMHSSFKNYYEMVYHWRKQLASHWKPKHTRQCFSFPSLQIIRGSPVLVAQLLALGDFWYSKELENNDAFAKSRNISVHNNLSYSGTVQSIHYP